MFLYSPVMVDSTSASRWRFQICEQSYIANMTDTLRESLSHECEMEGLTPPQSGQTLEHSTGDAGVDAWILSLAASRAKTCQLQESEPELLKETGADCGLNTQGSLMRYDRASHSLKTWQDSFLTDLTECSVTLPRWGMMRNGVLYRQRKPGLITEERGSGFWPTPRAQTRDNSSQQFVNGRRIAKTGAVYGVNLLDAVRLAMLPTPTVNMISGGGNHNSPSVKAGRHGLNLKGFAQMYPTPTSNTAKNTSDGINFQKRADKFHLDGVVALQEGTGKLNPQWVAWLMGLNTEWINLDSSVTEWFRSKPRSRSKFSAKG